MLRLRAVVSGKSSRVVQTISGKTFGESDSETSTKNVRNDYVGDGIATTDTPACE